MTEFSAALEENKIKLSQMRELFNQQNGITTFAPRTFAPRLMRRDFCAGRLLRRDFSAATFAPGDLCAATFAPPLFKK
uniref:Uncharacterized protein n=1 Tax=Meloidogyne enterolobii TaxID=390850 RepID=A0A6V7V017_MELEN|nr:unnamed protein product [Meloidogyne enterolobii]